jgi:hypothetical protein
VTAAVPAPSNRRSGIWINLPIAVVSMVICFYTLMPLDKGFPYFPLLGRPMSMAIVATGIAFLVTLVTSKGALLQYLGRKYFVYQTIFFGFLILSSFLSPSPLVAIQLAVRYYCTFAINYILILYLIEKYGSGWLIRAGAGAAMLSAVIAMVDTFGGYRLPFYATFFETAKVVENAEIGIDAIRGIGTMGNPILMSVLMLLAIPYVFSLRSPHWRAIGFILLLLGAATTVSRTFILGLIIFFAGWMIIYGKEFFKVLGVLIITFFALGISGVLDPLANDPRVQVWQSRMGLGGPGAEFATGNIETRGDASQQAIRRMEENWGPIEYLVGEGALASAEVGQDLTAGYNTIDNTTVTIIYERGIPAVLVFYGSFIVALVIGRKHARRSLHWYAPIALLACGISFNFEGFSTFNILIAGSLAIITARRDGLSDDPSAEAAPSLPNGTAPALI